MVMGYRNLAEAVILQSLEDLCHPSYRRESKEFFKGDGYKICAEIAEIPFHKKNNNNGGGRKHGRTAGLQRA